VANLGAFSRSALEARYFTYEAIVKNIARRRRSNAAFVADVLRSLADTDAIESVFNTFGLDARRYAPVAAAAVRRIRNIEDVPIVALLSAVYTGRDFASASETRFLGTLQANLLLFIRLARLLMTVDEGDVAANEFVATMSAAAVRASSAWDDPVRSRFIPEGAGRTAIFVDTEGYTRLRERIDLVLVRRDSMDRVYRDIDNIYGNRPSAATLEMNERDARAEPFGVPLRTWQIAEYERDLARERIRGVRVTTPAHSADWLGTHSFKSDQPTPYSIDVAEAVIVHRGSERLSAGYDFTGLHRLIVEALAAYKRDIASLKKRRRVETLQLYFNVLAQYAPSMHTKTIVSAGELVERLDRQLQ
jgi:hypothetical protein